MMARAPILCTSTCACLLAETPSSLATRGASDRIQEFRRLPLRGSASFSKSAAAMPAAAFYFYGASKKFDRIRLWCTA
jgi:hypothetical protein